MLLGLHADDALHADSMTMVWTGDIGLREELMRSIGAGLRA